ncbi:MAG: TerB family tellurite resistance protein [Pseudanabaena sp. M135S2SP2A07QC]|nr:TerB family tellurite resistance protein [Pseudanabaena sp. M090S1SP2A07QC]MCA6521956.1 TerB family tellurite resistance protein [Pseudanabaena sp. M051S1SP2A07QC]MCA6525868.1 TerB family tellurite resistance protein [Pseudanabaena sp. M179S2SP2A07QC]MCA6531537.1 TerB family tellurite resistance protein [Pseudanabaena sp. M125S2SP2A07QC]MCA6533510.1 TerB family tellurite resistance protein [Pseudanabaena sp. M176S2SP2A07QC]MCA6537612.1 TerB family tellurite resistance protein [Pseudanabaena
MTPQELPPPISPRQMDMLRAVAAMAWADGKLEPDEIRLMLDEFAMLFAKTEKERIDLKNRLKDYLDQNIPLEEVVPNIKSVEDRKMTLRLGYQVIQASRRNPDEPMINLDEAAAYQRLVRILDLPPDVVADIEASSIPHEESNPNGIIKALALRLHKLLGNAN